MDWKQLINKSRIDSNGNILSTEDSSAVDGRSEYQKDFDRIIFSGAFRRLQRKTQVHPLPTNDHVHTRLTHSLEVSCIGRSLGALAGKRLKDSSKLADDVAASDIGAIVQAACLTHDIGNPPFGHAGEHAIRDWFTSEENRKFYGSLNKKTKEDLKNFDGNAHGLRVATKLESNRNDGGLRLTCSTLAAFMKYPWSSKDIPSDKKCKFSYFHSESSIMECVAKTVGLNKLGKGIWSRHPLVYLVEAADDICYALIDLEDGMEMGVIRFDEFESIITPICEGLIGKEYAAIGNKSPRKKVQYLRGKAMQKMVKTTVDVFMDNEPDIIIGNFKGDLIKACAGPLEACISESKKIAREKIFMHPRKMQLEIGAYSAISIVLTAFCESAHEVCTSSDKSELSFKHTRILDLLGDNAPEINDTIDNSIMTIVDYVAGMTDDFATRLAQQISGMGL